MSAFIWLKFVPRFENAADLLSLADGLIVGTSVKRDGVVTNRVDPDRVRAFVRAAGHR